MQPTVYFAHWIYPNRMDFPIPVHIYNVHAGTPSNLEVFNVLNVSNEPEPTRMSNKKILEVADKYDLILTWDESLLHLPNAVMFYCGMCWIVEPNWQSINPLEKQFHVSTACTSKNLTLGHQKRLELWSRQSEIKIPRTFWNSAHNPMVVVDNNPTLGANPWEKFVMFKDSQFHIAIENSQYNNYFSEKLIDCFITKTIPIYIGAPNIQDYFNIMGMVCVSSVDGVIETCNEIINDKYYESYYKYVEENFTLCHKYAKDFTDRIQEVITENLWRKMK